MRSWVFRHRHRLLALLGKPAPAARPAAPAEPAPAPRVVTLLPARRGSSR
ncbi:MAG TPA: hypothetical protein VF530_23715 [Planctomycetota bacterium]